ISAREFLRIGTGLRMWRAVGIAFQRDGGRPTRPRTFQQDNPEDQKRHCPTRLVINHSPLLDLSQFIPSNAPLLSGRDGAAICKAVQCQGRGWMAAARKKILCIEHDREIAALIAQQLGRSGFEVSVAHTGQDGFVAILKDKPNLILCDIDVPIMSGFEILERLNEIAPRLGHVPFLFLSTRHDRDTELRARQLGADDYVTKPIDFAVLTAIIDARFAGVARTKLLPKLVKLNEREIEVLSWVARGKTSAQIARTLRMSKRTVDFHIDNARIKLNAATRSQAAIKAVAGGLIKP